MGGLFDFVHPFPESSEIPDDEALRLVYLSPSQYFNTTEELRYAQDAAKNYVNHCGTLRRRSVPKQSSEAERNYILCLITNTNQTFSIILWQSAAIPGIIQIKSFD